MSIANVGAADRIIRLVLGAVLIAFPFFSSTAADSTAGMIAIGVGVVLAATSFMSFCPLYALLRVNTGAKS